MNDPAASAALREAIQRDVGVRLDAIANRLEDEIESASRVEDLELLLAEALTEATKVFADGFSARIRESHR